jgi:Flp pilus assembly protein TadG
MKPLLNNRRRFWDDATGPQHRRGAMLVLSFFTLVASIGFVAFTVDVGIISHTKTRMQNAVDSAALAAVLEISHAIQTAGPDVEDVAMFAQDEAAAMAEQVMDLNGIYIDPAVDVIFGTRSWDAGSEEFVITWGTANANVVKVVARKDNGDTSAPDAKLNLFFAGFFGDDTVELTASATAYIESRDIVSVLDFSRSMNFDSYFNTEANSMLSDAEIAENIGLVWDDLQPLNIGNMTYTPAYVTLSSGAGTAASPKATVTFKYATVDVTATSTIDRVKLTFSNGNTQSFFPGSTGGTFAGTSSNAGKDVTQVDVRFVVNGEYVTKSVSDTNTNIKSALGLSSLAYPFTVGSWSEFLDYVGTDTGIRDAGYREMYGGMTFVCYILCQRSGHWETPQLCETRHYPFHSVKEGQLLLCDFLENLGFGDELGTVSYDTYHRGEHTLDVEGYPEVNISDDPISDDFDACRALVQYKQAAHYAYATNIGGGLKDAITMLDEHCRVGARPAIVLMTDGNTNTIDAGEDTSLPGDWNWDEMFDYDGDGVGDYYTDSTQKRYVLKQAYNAIDKGYTVHTLAIGQDADTGLMQAIAHMGGGEYLAVAGGTTVSEMQAEVEAAYNRIAALVPPAQLLQDE